MVRVLRQHLQQWLPVAVGQEFLGGPARRRCPARPADIRSPGGNRRSARPRRRCPVWPAQCLGDRAARRPRGAGTLDEPVPVQVVDGGAVGQMAMPWPASMFRDHAHPAGGPPVTKKTSIPAASAAASAAIVRADTVLSSRSSVPSRSVAISRGEGAANGASGERGCPLGSMAEVTTPSLRIIAPPTQKCGYPLSRAGSCRSGRSLGSAVVQVLSWCVWCGDPGRAVDHVVR